MNGVACGAGGRHGVDDGPEHAASGLQHTARADAPEGGEARLQPHADGRRRERSRQEHADPVAALQVRVRRAPAHLRHRYT